MLEIIEIKEKYKRIKIDDNDKGYLKEICKFNNENIEVKVKDLIKSKCDDKRSGEVCGKRVWVLFGRDNKDEDWICIEVGSSNNIEKEIKENLKQALKKSEEVWKGSEFYKGSKLFLFRTYSDKHSIKWRTIIKICKNFCFCEIDVNEYLKTDEMFKTIEHNWKKMGKTIDKINYVETKYAYDKKAIFWNPAPQTNGNQEKEILNAIKDEKENNNEII